MTTRARLTGIGMTSLMTGSLKLYRYQRKGNSAMVDEEEAISSQPRATLDQRPFTAKDAKER
jgi:hypothetical protein